MNKKIYENLTEQPHTTMTQSPEYMTQTLKDSRNMLASTADLTETEQTLPPTPDPIFVEVNQRCQISAERLKRYSDSKTLPTDTRTAPDLDIGFGQQRALKALRTALDIKASGYHVFAAGENGLGKRTVIRRLLQRIAADAPTPDDWVYVHNFTDPRTPVALRLPAGQATLLQQQINNLWQQAKKRLTQRFRSDQYQSKIEIIKNDTHQKESYAYDALNAEGKQYDLALTFRPFDNKAVFVHPSQLPSEAGGNAVDDYANNDAKTAANNKNSNPQTTIDKAKSPSRNIENNSDHEAELNNFAQKNHMQVGS